MQKKLKSFDGIAITYETHGKGKDFIVFLHGLGGDLSAWKLVTEGLPYPFIAIDLRGHGLSGRPDKIQDYALENFAKDVHEVIEKEKVKSFVLCGHCFGGMIAQVYHRLYPSAAKAYILISTCHKRKGWFRESFNPKSPLFMLMNPVLSKVKVKKGSHVDFSKFIGTTDYDLKRIILSDMKNTSFKSWMFSFQQDAELDEEATIKSMTQPVLIIHGEKDRVLSVNISKEMHKKIKNSKLVTIPNANHIVVFNNPNEVREEIIKFSKEVF